MATAPKKAVIQPPQAVRNVKTIKATTRIEKPIVAAVGASEPVLSQHDQWMQAAGIAVTDWPYANRIVELESSWRAGAVEPKSGACGIVQELPCGKSGCIHTDNVCELAWAQRYVFSRYGSWYAALIFHLAHSYY